MHLLRFQYCRSCVSVFRMRHNCVRLLPHRCFATVKTPTSTDAISIGVDEQCIFSLSTSHVLSCMEDDCAELFKLNFDINMDELSISLEDAGVQNEVQETCTM